MQWFNIGMMNSDSTAEDLKKSYIFINEFIWLGHNIFYEGTQDWREIFQTVSLYRAQSYGETFKMPLRPSSAIYIKFNFIESNLWTIYDKKQT